MIKTTSLLVYMFYKVFVCLITHLNLKLLKLCCRKGLEAGEIFFKTKDKHRGLAFIHLQLGKLYHQNKEYSQAKEHYLKSETIFNNVLKNHAVDDVSELYKQLAMLGIDAREEELARDYIKKLVKVFGLNHNRTQEVILYADEKGLVLHP